MKTCAKKIALLVLLISGFSLSSHAVPRTPEVDKLCAKNGTDLPFLVKRKIKITDYKKETDSYVAIAADFPGEGSSFVTLDALSKGIPSLVSKTESIQEDPESIIDHTYVSESKIPTLDEDENAARKVCGKKL